MHAHAMPPSPSRPSALRPSLGSPARPPKAPPPRKAASAAECERLEQLPNIGPSIAADLRLIGVLHPAQLAEADALALYQALQAATGKRQDPCVLDTFMAACAFMRGGPTQPWWAFTAERKQRYGVV
jgi:Pathogenicity locus